MTSNQSFSWEDNKLMEYMLERAISSETPLCIGQMCEEFVDKNGSKLTGKYYRARFMKKVRQTENMSNYNIEEIAKLYFVTSLAPSDNFLRRLRDIADVEVDADNKLVKFKGQRIQFEGAHELVERVRKFDEYKAEKAKRNMMLNASQDSSTNSSDFCSTKPNESPIEIDCSLIEYGVENSLSKFEIQANLCAEDNFRTFAIEKNITQLFEGFSDPLAFPTEQKNYQSPILKDDSTEATEENCSLESDIKTLKFLAKKSKRSEFPLVMNHLWEEYVKEVETDRTQQSVQSRFQIHLAPKIYRMKEFDFHTKVKMLYASGTPVNEQFLRQLHEHASVQLDENNVIVKYEFKNDDAFDQRRSHTHSTDKDFQERKRSYHKTEDSTKKVFSGELQREVNPLQKTFKFPTSKLDSTGTHSPEKRMTNKVEDDMLTGKREIAFPFSNLIAPEFRNFVPYDPKNPPLTAYFGGPAYHTDSLADYPQLSEKFFAQFYPSTTPATRGFEELLSNVNQENNQCRKVHASEVFNQLKAVLLSLDYPFVNELIEQVEQIIKDFIKSGELLPLSELHCIFKSCLIRISRKCHTKTHSEEECMDSKDFLNIFKHLLLNVDGSVFTDIENQIKEQVSNVELEHQVISVSDIQQIINFLITTFSG